MRNETGRPATGDSITAKAPAEAVPAIEVRGLRKVYRGSGGRGPVTALDGVDLSIPAGSFFALLGPNGAGKSTFINILAGLVARTEGSVRIAGHDIDREMRAARRAIGVVPQELNIDPFFTPRAAMEFQAGLYGVRKSERQTDRILAAMGLTDKAESYARSLSGGMRRRLLVAKAMVHRPAVLILDEPTAGVDVELRQQLWEYIRELNVGGVTVLLTTHYLEEAEQLCDRIAIIDRGKVVACERTETLVQRLDSKSLKIRIREPLEILPEGLATLGASLPDPNIVKLDYRPSATAIGEVLSRVQAAGLEIVDLSTEEADLEDAFLQLTRR
ncbi:ABC transporter ATP-binding protein [Oceanibacterium hippocampi]|nr:ABC transporter ATP-binding protein [Oceanibacterium hippocampi]